MGGYVWEFRSHGFEKVNSDGTTDYLYGGDFHDTNHWTNFTLDGYFRSDGTPKPTFSELKYVFAPIRLNLKNGEQISDSPKYFLTELGEKTKKLTELYTYTPLESEREAVECNEE